MRINIIHAFIQLENKLYIQYPVSNIRLGLPSSNLCPENQWKRSHLAKNTRVVPFC